MADILKLKINPYREAGSVHDTGLADMIANIDTTPTVEEIVDDVKEYFYDHYFTSRSTESIPRESIGTIVARAVNLTTDFETYISSLEISDEAKKWLIKVANFMDQFQKYAYISDKNIFNFSLEFNGSVEELEDEILNSGLSEDRQILPLIGLAVLKSSYVYWKAVYENTGGSNAWFTWITATIGGIEVSEMDWKAVLKSDVKGAIVGSVQAFVNKETFQSIVVGGAAGSIATATKEISVQVFKFLQDTDGLLTGGEAAVAEASNAKKVTKRVVNVTTCASGYGVTLPKAKAGNAVFVKNNGAETCTIAATGSDTINGSSTTTIAAAAFKNFYCAVSNAWITD
ncbi:MAG: hypothetical protein A2X08_10445 [Bacteroidetes bacterium GWA2_32_17]|nr:MAG: hypothetical protein A2X08_10445 [Bacteroidetes bacterium GWA2_32_17]